MASRFRRRIANFDFLVIILNMIFLKQLSLKCQQYFIHKSYIQHVSFA